MLAQSYPDDMPLSELRTPEILLLATLRLFAQSARGEMPQHWWEGLMAANVPDEAIQGLANLFGVIAVAPRRKLAVACMHYRFLCPDEGRFLQLIALLQRGNVEGAEEVLQNWVAPAAARLSIPHAQALADGLAAQGLLLPRRCVAAGMFADHAGFPAPAYLH